MSDHVLWLHTDWLNLTALGEPAPAVFVFDDAQLQMDGWTLKRIGFLYECLLELPVEIRRGHPPTEVAAFAAVHGATGVVTMDTPDPRLRAQMEELRQIMPIEIRSEPPFVELGPTPDLRRFSRYWQKAMPKLIR
ncbi:MAG: hypothetical protein JNK87_00060 [Bryobacterales bacterium]|nr:hypothetical protein [Bryobacterales bacterium]